MLFVRSISSNDFSCDISVGRYPKRFPCNDSFLSYLNFSRVGIKGARSVICLPLLNKEHEF